MPLRSPESRHIRKAILIASIAAIVVLAAAFATTGVPDVAGIIGEQVTVSMLKSHKDQNSVERWFRLSGADWHNGIAWESGESNSSSASGCSKNCACVLQVAFTKRAGLCEIFGDRITMRFDDNRHLESWAVEPSEDGC